MNVTVLVDFVNDSVRTALEVADALGDDLWGVRLDTSDTLADESLRRLHGDEAPKGVAAELVELTRSELDDARLSRTSTSSSPAASTPTASARSRRPACPWTPTASAPR